MAAAAIVEVFKVLSRDRVMQRLVEQIIETSSRCAHGSRSRFSPKTGFTSVSWSRTSKPSFFPLEV